MYDSNYIHFGKGKISVIVRISVVSGDSAEDSVGWTGDAQGILLIQWYYSVWYCNGGFTSLYICQNPQNAEHKEWTIMQTMHFS